MIQGRHDLGYPRDWSKFEYESDNLLVTTIFGGTREPMLWLANALKSKFLELLHNNNTNNEQVAFALIWSDNKDKFEVFINYTHSHLPYFKHLAST